MTDTVLKGLCPFKTKDSQPAARIICSLKANKFHTCRLRSVFCDVHAAAKNGLHFICRLRAANSARLFWHTDDGVASATPPFRVHKENLENFGEMC